ncbi:multidrug resistance-associated ABC transporter [Phanerochaete sordida]|uniref:Multidrug resistance-associated ABC transporter n=1 Tax=Phanerochaete sordida TaxID=48140 RepID=A0A9P3G2F1_9APHY|nr:multidrug resistance-associated ABC transporter [Phanerochaete sordida]
MSYTANLQTILVSSFEASHGRLWLDERIFPCYVATVSLLTLIASDLFGSVFSPEVHKRVKDELEAPSTSCGFIVRRGGGVIFAFKLARLASVFTLLALTVIGAAQSGSESFWIYAAQVLAVASNMFPCLAALNVIAPAEQGLRYSFHLSGVTFLIAAVYAYRDIWPLMTLVLQPKDGHEGRILWAKIALVTFAGGIEPLLEPYPYIPFDPLHHRQPSPEQTSSIFSMILYIWLEPLIWHAYRVPHLPATDLPPLCDYDETKNLIGRSQHRLDPFSGAKKRHLFWGLLSIFRRTVAAQAVLITINGFVSISIPIGTNRLLRYLETDGEEAFLKPWVWILWVGGAPIIMTIVFQYQNYVSTGLLVRVQSVITSLVFDHALRIRLKAEVPDKTAAKETVKPPPLNSDVQGPDGSDSDDAKTVQSRATGVSASTAPSNATVSTSATLVPPIADPKNHSNGAETTPSKATTGSKAQEKKGDAHQGGHLMGRITNLVTSDLSNITSGRDFLLLILSTPLRVTLSILFLYSVLGWSSFVGLGVMVALLPVPTWLAARLQDVQKQKMKVTDARVQTVAEIMSVLRMVKLFGWEQRMNEKVAEKREEELNLIWKRRLIELTNICINYCIPLVHMVVTYAIFTLVMKRELTASVVFSSMTAFDKMRGYINRVADIIPQLISANVSLTRVADFLNTTELLDSFTESGSGQAVSAASEAHRDDIGFGDVAFSWTNEGPGNVDTPAASPQTFRLRIDTDVHFKRGAFNLIVGPTGSGKTSVLMALLGEMHYIPLGPDSWMHLPRAGGVAYAAQESWIQSETIRENILFGAPFDEERYEKAVYQCGLTRDLSLFDAGDATEVGEKGLTLSGGQKARVTLARAVYSSAEILLLDDVLAALDVHTARWVVDKCFKGDLVRGRTVLLVTHNIALASPLAEFVVSLQDGNIASQGSASEVLDMIPELQEEMKHEQEAIQLDEAEDAVVTDTSRLDVSSTPDTKTGKLVVAEEIALGRISWAAFKLLLVGLGGRFPPLFWGQFLVGETMSDVFGVVQMWWLGYWAGQYAQHDASEVRVAFYLEIYCAFVAATILTHVYAQIIYTVAMLRSSRSIHAKLVTSLLASTFRWLDVTPISRVTTRCTQDVQAIDNQVPRLLGAFVHMVITSLIKVGAIVLFTPVFLLPAVFIAGLGGFLGQVFIKAQLSVKREMSNAKAPVLGVFGSTLHGLISIRAYGAQQACRATLHERQDRYVRAARSFYNVNRWIGTRLNLLGDFFVASLAYYLLYGPLRTNPSVVGFVISQAVGLSDLILVVIRLFNNLEVNSNSLERIKQYLDIEHEPESTSDGTPPAYWPSSGDVRVEGLSARYSPDGPKVLQDISFHVKPGQRVGVVGRTGSGKSTLTLALLRCIYTEGRVTLDGLDTASANLDALRSHITIIPQVPELLSGTLRHNLDVFAQHDDATLHGALRAAGLFRLHASADARRLTLDTDVASAGANLSVGQRQIVALARAIVRGSKLLVLDEATSAIDYETDAVIQAALRTELARDVTVVTVAHRLQTVMDYDKIMVLDAGRLIEYDSPRALLQKEGSLLRALVDESADRDALYALAEGRAAA